MDLAFAGLPRWYLHVGCMLFLTSAMPVAAELQFDGDLCWNDPQTNAATHWQVARSDSASFTGRCRFFTVPRLNPDQCLPDTTLPPAGETFFYLVRGDTWGMNSDEQERVVEPDPWEGVARDVATTTLGNRVGIVCHNCYYDRYAAETGQPHVCVGGSNDGQACASGADCPGSGASCEWNDFDATLDFIHQAQAEGADAIELDVAYGLGTTCSTPGAPDVEIRHDTFEGTCFADVLADPGLRSGDQFLFVESKAVPSDTQLEALLCLFLAPGEQPSTCGDTPRYPEYATPARPLFLRALWGDRAFIHSAAAKLRTAPFDELRGSVRLHLSFLNADTPTAEGTYNSIDAFAPEVDGFEFDFRDANLLAKTTYVRSLGLQVAVFGNKKYCLGDMYVASMREDVDFLIVDYPAGLARRVVEEDNRLLYMNVWDQFEPWNSTGAPTEVKYWDWNPGAPKQLAVTADTPQFAYVSREVNEDLFGGVLDFDETQWLPFADDSTPDLDRLDNWSCGGYLVTAVLNHDGGGFTSDDIVSKAENSGFYLDLQSGNLRFGVHQGGSYKTASLPEVLWLNGTNSFLIVGAYDGHGNVRLWVNDGQQTASLAGDLHGGVTTNDWPIFVGADPGAGGPGDFFDGKIQRVSVLAWGNHPVPPDAPYRYDGQNIDGDCNPVPHIDVEKAVNAVVPEAPTPEEDADCPPGHPFTGTEAVVFTYLVTNPGSSPLDMTGIAIQDGALVIEPVLDASATHNIGDIDNFGWLDPDEVWRYSASGGGAPLPNYSSEAVLDGPGNTGDCDRNYYYVIP